MEGGGGELGLLDLSSQDMLVPRVRVAAKMKRKRWF